MNQVRILGERRKMRGPPHLVREPVRFPECEWHTLDRKRLGRIGDFGITRRTVRSANGRHHHVVARPPSTEFDVPASHATAVGSEVLRHEEVLHSGGV
jgi:hypothetical protein